MSQETIGVLIADDHRVLREGLRALLEEAADIRVVGEAEDGRSAIDRTALAQPDVVVMDLAMPGLNGFEAMRQIRDRDPGVKIIVLSMHGGRDFVKQALEAGCDGYVPKSSTHTDLVRAIRVVHQGQRFLHPTAATAVVEELLGAGRDLQQLELLSDRERQVLQYTAMGYSSRETATRLNISPKTVETYRARLMNKLDLSGRSELVHTALKLGLLDESCWDEA
jgi:DNA-binding NarL/FixJ family response regulator